MQQNKLSNIPASEVQIDPSKIKPGNKDNVILNKQDENSYEEPVTDNTPKKQETTREEVRQDDFEYPDNGEFEEGAQITNTDTNEEFI